MSTPRPDDFASLATRIKSEVTRSRLVLPRANGDGTYHEVGVELVHVSAAKPGKAS